MKDRVQCTCAGRFRLLNVRVAHERPHAAEPTGSGQNPARLGKRISISLAPFHQFVKNSRVRDLEVEHLSASFLAPYTERI